MSIPLVQNNEKDSINTSIIAIKRNIERINMLLGLSNSEEIDTSKFATKEELQQAVTDLQPVDEVTVDNMHSVTSNAVAKKFEQRNIYGYTETKTVNGWDYLVNLGVLKGKYAIMIFSQGASLYAIGTTSTTYESGYVANNVTVLRVITFPDNNTEDIFASGYISPQGEISFNVIAFKVM